MGSAIKVHDDEADQIVVIIASPGGLEVNRVMPTNATPSNASPTHTPEPSSKKSTNKKIDIGASCSMVSGYSN